MHATPIWLGTELEPHTGFKVGIAWQGNARHKWDSHRSFPVHWFGLLARIEGVVLVSLQKGSAAAQLACVPFPVVDLSSRLDENAGFQDTAALMRSLDLVITCDSALAHLAGALRVPTWLALSELADWRWMHDREDTPWYPTTRLFRQAKLGNWRSVFEPVCNELRLAVGSSAR